MKQQLGAIKTCDINSRLCINNILPRLFRFRMFCGCRILHTVIKGDQIQDVEMDEKNIQF